MAGKFIYIDAKLNNSNTLYYSIFLTAILTLGIALAFMPCVSGEKLLFCDFRLWLILIIMVTALYLGFLSSLKSNKLSVFIAIASIILVIFILSPSALYRGFLATADRLMELWNIKYEDALEYYNQDFTVWDLQSFDIFAAIVISAIIWYIINKGEPIAIGIIALAALVIANILGCGIILPACIIFAAWLALWFKEVSGRFRGAGLVWMAVLFVLFGFVYAFIGSESLDTVDNIHTEIENSKDKLKYGDDTLPKGDLSKACDMLKNYDSRLSVTSDYAKTLYLKGYVGERYNNGKWESLPRSAYRGKNNGIFKWLKENNFIPQEQYSYYLSLCDNSSYEELSVKVKNKGAYRRFVYLPYSVMEYDVGYSSADKGRQIISSLFTGCRDYTFSESSENIPSELIQNESWLISPKTEEQKKYIETEKIYRSFVYENYTDIPDEYTDIMNEMFWKGNEDNDINIYEATERIREVLSDNIIAADFPKSAPENTDPLKWCILKSKEGNSVFFASASVLAYRAIGIPARYAEGYLVTENMELSGNGEAEVTSQNSHAWAEVYFDGIGWLPIDNTPGYYFDAYNLEQILMTNHSPEKTGKDFEGTPGDLSGAEALEDNDDSVTKKAVFTFLAALGIITLLVMALIILIIIMELIRYLRKISLDRAYYRLDEKSKTIFLYKRIEAALRILGIDSVLGKDSHITDKAVADKLDSFKAGEYMRIYDLVEKTVYGDIELKAYEQRTVENFLVKLMEYGKILDLRSRIKLRYIILTIK